jgi:hypothetical protein
MIKLGNFVIFLLKGQCHEIFDYRFFHESVSPHLQSFPLGPFRIFSKIRGDIRNLTKSFLRFSFLILTK